VADNESQICGIASLLENRKKGNAAIACQSVYELVMSIVWAALLGHWLLVKVEPGLVGVYELLYIHLDELDSRKCFMYQINEDLTKLHIKEWNMF